MSESAKYWAVFSASFASSLGGFFYFVFISPSPEDAGRGADIGLAITLGFLFVSHDYGSRFFTALTKTAPSILQRIKDMRESRSSEAHPPTNQELEEHINVLAKALDMDRQGHDTENKFLAAATVLATIVSGFGDLIAKHLIELLK